MAKTEPKKHTEQVMRKAVQQFERVSMYLELQRDDDHPPSILTDVVNELLEARQTIEEVRAFVQVQAAKMQRR